MKTYIHLPQKIKTAGISQAIYQYQKRIIDVKLEIVTDSPPVELSPRQLVAVDPGGQQITTEALHNWLIKKLRTDSRVDFLIGGKAGLSSKQIETAGWSWSLGSLVLNQGVAALVVVEQLYRCYALRTNHPYHSVD